MKGMSIAYIILSILTSGFSNSIIVDLDSIPRTSLIRRVSEVAYNEDPETKLQVLYDNEGRITQEIRGRDTISYQYMDNLLIKNIHKTDYWLVAYRFLLNDGGQVESCQIIGQDEVLISNIGYLYNTQGQIMKMVRLDHQFKDDWVVFDYIIDDQSLVIYLNEFGQKISYTFTVDPLVPVNWNPHMIFADLFPPISLDRFDFIPSSVTVWDMNNNEILSQIVYKIEYHTDRIVCIEKDLLNDFKNTIIYSLK
jgi:hypothetical protein